MDVFFNMLYAEFIQIMYRYAYHVWTYHDLSPFALTSRSLGTLCSPFDRFWCLVFLQCLSLSNWPLSI